MDLVHIIDALIGILVLGFGYWASTLSSEVKRIEILLNRTREEYVTRSEVREDMSRVMEALHRVEDKLDKALDKR
jgi:non-ribosomal peptide synthetase component F